MVNGAASVVYVALFLLALIPVGVYCHLAERNESRDNKHDD